jgi:hypothetical protein
LGADADDLRLEAADAIAGAAVATDLFVDVADDSDLKPLRQELRPRPNRNAFFIAETRACAVAFRL